MQQYHKGKILMVNNDAVVRRVFRTRFEKVGYKIITVANDKEVLMIFDKEAPDLIVLDVMMPDIDGYLVCKELRKTSDVPIIMLTALEGIEDRIYGFHCGADDYLVKPFSLKELEARINSILRRTKWSIFEHRQSAAPIKVGDLAIDFNQRKVTFADRSLLLTDAEFDILQLLVKNSGLVLSRAEILQKIWGSLPQSQDNLRRVDVYISRLRTYLESNPRQPEYIFTARGTGYFFRRIDSTNQSEK